MSDLSILCVTRGEVHAHRFILELGRVQHLLDAELVVALDGNDPHPLFDGFDFALRVRSTGDIGSVLDEALTACTRSYVLRIDDDERCSDAMVEWLERRDYEAGQHWKFSRAHLWGDAQHILLTPHLWPDHQTRLSWKRFAGNRRAVHAGSPYGGGVEAPVAIEHHKFLVRSLEFRREMIRRYDSIQPGAGSHFRMFSCPEDFYTESQIADSVAKWDGRTITWERAA